MSQKHLIGLRCDSCGRAGYISRKNVKQVARKLEFNKFCKWCKKTTKHKEAKLPIKAAPKKQVAKPKKVAAVPTDKVAKAPKAAAPKAPKAEKPKAEKK